MSNKVDGKRGEQVKTDINVPRIDDPRNEDIPPFEERVSNQIDWIRYYVANMDARLSARVSALTVAVFGLGVAVGFLFARI